MIIGFSVFKFAIFDTLVKCYLRAKSIIGCADIALGVVHDVSIPHALHGLFEMCTIVIDALPGQSVAIVSEIKVLDQHQQKLSTLSGFVDHEIECVSFSCPVGADFLIYKFLCFGGQKYWCADTLVFCEFILVIDMIKNQKMSRMRDEGMSFEFLVLKSKQARPYIRT